MKTDFPNLLKHLQAFEVDHVLVGGMAANVHGSPITTMDCDIVVAHLTRLAEALSSFAPTFRHKEPPQSFGEDEAQRSGWKNIHLDTDAGVLDCLGEIKGLGDYTSCLAQSMEVSLGDFSIRVLTRQALITAKKAMGRPKDLLTVAQLEIGGELEGK
ncbi:MAG: hypothetical protein ACSHX7_13235 [Luteolibacter sp.]